MVSEEISIIMPVYNSERYLKEAIDSILNQTFRNFELLIINDGSSDSSENIVKSYSDCRIKYIVNEKNMGIAATLNKGISLAKGNLIARADSDDINRPYRLKLQYDFLIRHPDIYIIGGGYAPFDVRGHRSNIYHPSNELMIAYKYIFDSFFCHPTVMLRKSILKDFENYPNVPAEDFAFFSRIVRKFKPYNIRSILIDYREHNSNLSIVKKDMIQNSVEEISKDNFKFYIGTLNGYLDFKNYVKHGKLNNANLFLIININDTILNRIVFNYKENKNLTYLFLKIRPLLVYVKYLLYRILKP